MRVLTAVAGSGEATYRQRSWRRVVQRPGAEMEACAHPGADPARVDERLFRGGRGQEVVIGGWIVKLDDVGVGPGFGERGSGPVDRDYGQVDEWRRIDVEIHRPVAERRRLKVKRQGAGSARRNRYADAAGPVHAVVVRSRAVDDETTRDEPGGSVVDEGERDRARLRAYGLRAEIEWRRHERERRGAGLGVDTAAVEHQQRIRVARGVSEPEATGGLSGNGRRETHGDRALRTRRQRDARRAVRGHVPARARGGIDGDVGKGPRLVAAIADGDGGAGKRAIHAVAEEQRAVGRAEAALRRGARRDGKAHEGEENSRGAVSFVRGD